MATEVLGKKDSSHCVQAKKKPKKELVAKPGGKVQGSLEHRRLSRGGAGVEPDGLYAVPGLAGPNLDLGIVLGPCHGKLPELYVGIVVSVGQSGVFKNSTLVFHFHGKKSLNC